MDFILSETRFFNFPQGLLRITMGQMKGYIWWLSTQIYTDFPVELLQSAPMNAHIRIRFKIML